MAERTSKRCLDKKIIVIRAFFELLFRQNRVIYMAGLSIIASVAQAVSDKYQQGLTSSISSGFGQSSLWVVLSQAELEVLAPNLVSFHSATSVPDDP